MIGRRVLPVILGLAAASCATEDRAPPEPVALKMPVPIEVERVGDLTVEMAPTIGSRWELATFLEAEDGMIALPPGEKIDHVSPLHGIVVGGGKDEPGTLHLFYSGLERLPFLGDAPLNMRTSTVEYRSLGVGLAQGRPAAFPLEPVLFAGDWRLFSADEPAFGVAVVQADHGVTTGFDYVFGMDSGVADFGVEVARVPHGRLADRAAYRYLAQGGVWTREVDDAIHILEGVSGLSVWWNPHLQGFLAVYAHDKTVVARLSTRPEGPYGPPTILIPRDTAYEFVVAREIPSLGKGDGSVLHVGVLSHALGETETFDAHIHGGPRLYRITLP